MSVLTNAPRFWAIQGQTFSYLPDFWWKYFDKFGFEPHKRAIEIALCLLECQLLLQFYICDQIQVGTNILKLNASCCAKFCLFSSVHLFGHIYEWDLSRWKWNNIRYWGSEAWKPVRKSFRPRRESACIQLSAICQRGCQFLMGRQNFLEKTDENWGNQCLQLVCE